MEAVPVTLLVVAQSTNGDTFVLDVLCASGDGPARPIALVLARPDTVWFDAAIERILRSWAEDGRVLHLRVRRSARKDVAVLEPDGGDSSLRLDLMAVA